MSREWIGTLAIAGAIIFVGYMLTNNLSFSWNMSMPNINFASIPSPSDNIDEYQGYTNIITISPSSICAGNNVVGNIDTNIPNGGCAVFVNPNAAGWTILGQINLNAQGDYTITQPITTTGYAVFQAICCDNQANCKSSNEATLTVSTCATDTDGDGFTDSEEMAAGTDPYDPTDYPGSSNNYYCCLVMGLRSCFEGGCPSSGILLNTYASMGICQANCPEEPYNPASTTTTTVPTGTTTTLTGWYWCCGIGADLSCFATPCPAGYDLYGQSASLSLCQDTCHLNYDYPDNIETWDDTDCDTYCSDVKGYQCGFMAYYTTSQYCNLLADETKCKPSGLTVGDSYYNADESLCCCYNCVGVF